MRNSEEMEEQRGIRFGGASWVVVEEAMFCTSSREGCIVDYGLLSVGAYEFLRASLELTWDAMMLALLPGSRDRARGGQEHEGAHRANHVPRPRSLYCL